MTLYGWALILIFLDPVPGFDRAYLLEQYKTYEECAPEADRVFKDMQAAYPGDTSFTIQCVRRDE